jgi:hypothetical protein
MTPKQLQAHAAALGYPWVAAHGYGGRWRMFALEPHWVDLAGGYWTSDGVIVVALVKIDYDGAVIDSLRGPKQEAKP